MNEAHDAWRDMVASRFEDYFSKGLIEKVIGAGYQIPEELHPHYAPEALLDRTLKPTADEWIELRRLRNRMPQDGFISTLSRG